LVAELLPVPRKKVDAFIGWMRQYVGKPGLRIDVVHLAGFDQSIDGGGTMAMQARNRQGST
jgi:hypothetical protein